MSLPIYTPPAYLTPRPGEQTLKVWLMEKAAELGVSTTQVSRLVKRGKLPMTISRQVNRKVIFVKTESEKV